MVKKISVLTAVLLAVAFIFNVGDARATLVPIVNAGFEDPIFDDSDPKPWTDVAPPGWTQIGYGDGYVGAWRVTDDDFNAQSDGQFAAEGRNVAYTETPHQGWSWVGLEQTLDWEFAADKHYTLSVDVGNSDWYYFSGYRVQLLAGDTVIAQDKDTLHPDWGEWATTTVEYTYDPDNFSLVGQLLRIRLINRGRNPEDGDDSWVGVEFDNVSLQNDNIPTPEPATMLLLGAGLLGLAGVGRKKFFRK